MLLNSHLGSITMDLTPGEKFLLVFLLIRCTRGAEGIPIVCDSILAHQLTFENNFHVFCQQLVSTCRNLNKGRQISYMAHREGLHMQYSGMNFINSLRRLECRQGLLDYATRFGPIFDRLLAFKRETYLTAAEIKEMGTELSNYVVLAVQDKYKYVGKYNSMDAMRCLMIVAEVLIGCMPTPYSQELHDWFISRQSKKYKQATTNILQYFCITGASSVNEFISRIRTETRLGATVCFATIYVLFCETRVVINQYGARSICYLIQQYKRSPKLRAHTESIRQSLARTTSTKAHTLIVIEGMIQFMKLTKRELRDKMPEKILTAIDISYELGVLRICTKVSLDGIPEWGVLRDCLAVVYAQLRQSTGLEYEELRRAATAVGIKVFDKNGVRKHKNQLQKEVGQYIQKPHLTGRLKRTHAQLVAAVKAKGGNILSPCGSGKRVRMSKRDMQAYLDTH